MLFQHPSPVECRSCVVYAQNSILCQFGNLEICPNFANPYLTQFSSISGGNCITPLCITICCISAYTIIIWVLMDPMRRVPGRLPVIGGRNKQQTNKFFPAPFIYSRTSLHLLLQPALHEGHVYCLWPLPCILLVCTTLVCVLFVATTMYTISVYYFSMCVLL